jgi:DNA polymerase II small subunit/DNA polymerase delta subunit B
MMDPSAPRGFLIRIGTWQQFTRFEGIQQVHLRAGRAAAGGGRNRLK